MLRLSNEQEPLISVVTVTLNAGELLAETAASVAQQTFQEYEHLVKDGASLDGSVDRLRPARRLRILTARDTGIYDAMNQAVRLCRGKYVLFLNAGDRFAAPDALERLAAAVRTHPDLDFVYTDYFSDECGTALRSPGRLTSFFLFRTNPCHQAFLFRSDCFARFGWFDTSFRVGADHEFLLRAVALHHARYVYLPFVSVRYRGRGLSRSLSLRSVQRVEWQRVRRSYYSPARRALYSTVLAATLPRLRSAVHDVPVLTAFRRPYLACVNTCYALSSALQERRGRPGGRPNGRREADTVLVLSLGRNGGCVRYAAEIASAWTGRPCEVLLSSYATESPPRCDQEHVRTYRSPGEFVLRSLSAYPWLLGRTFLQLLRGRYCGVYVPYFHHWELGFIVLFRLFGRRVVYTLHDHVLHAGERTGLRARTHTAIMRRSVEAADDVVCLTNHVADEARRRYSLRGRVLVVPHGPFDLSEMSSHHPHSSRPVLLFLGRVYPYKGVELLVEAVRGMARHEYEELVIAGRWGYARTFEPPEGTTIIDRWLSDREMAKLLTRAHILVLPYREATQSGVLAMAMAARLPVVCSAVGGLVDQLSRGAAVFVDPAPESIREGIRTLIRDPDRYSEMSRCLGDLAKARSWDEIARQVSDLFAPHGPGSRHS